VLQAVPADKVVDALAGELARARVRADVARRDLRRRKIDICQAHDAGSRLVKAGEDLMALAALFEAPYGLDAVCDRLNTLGLEPQFNERDSFATDAEFDGLDADDEND
jgi:hypothetical protein